MARAKTTKRTRTRRTKATAPAVVKKIGAHRAPVPASVNGLMRGPTIHEIAPNALLGFGSERMCFLSLD